MLYISIVCNHIFCILDLNVIVVTWRTEVAQWEWSILILGSQVPSALSTICGIQREAKTKQTLFTSSSSALPHLPTHYIVI